MSMRKGKSSEASWLEMVEGDYRVLTDLCVHPHRTASGYLYREKEPLVLY